VQDFQITLFIIVTLQLHFSCFLLFWVLHIREETTYEFGVRFGHKNFELEFDIMCEWHLEYYYVCIWWMGMFCSRTAHIKMRSSGSTMEREVSSLNLLFYKGQSHYQCSAGIWIFKESLVSACVIYFRIGVPLGLVLWKISESQDPLVLVVSLINLWFSWKNW
jgi:hypothetical protein